MSNNLDLSQIASNQLNKYITANDQAGELDAAITEPMAVPVDDTNAVTLTAAAFRGLAIIAWIASLESFACVR